MARLVTSGGEIRDHPVAAADASPDGFSAGAAATVTDLATFRSGLAAIKCPGLAASTSFRQWDITAPASTVPVYARAYVRFSALPNATKKIMALTNGATGLVSAKLTSAGKLQLFNDRAGTQIGSDSTDTLVVDAWYRVELMLKVNTTSTAATANDDVELRLYVEESGVPPVVVATATAQGVGNVTPTNLKVGWVDAPGVTSDMFIDDVALNDNTGTKQTGYPGEGRVLFLPVALLTRSNFTTCTSSTIVADLVTATSQLPPVSHVDMTADTAHHQARCASATATSNLTCTCRSYGYYGAPGNVLIEPPVATERKLGDVSADTKWSASFFLAGSVDRVEVYLKAVGAPTDDVIVELQTDDGTGKPSGTVLATESVPAASVTTAFAWFKLLTIANIGLTAATRYHLVFSRAGAIDAANYYVLATPLTGPGERTIGFWNGVVWQLTTSHMVLRVYSSQGTTILSLVQPVACHAEAVTAGTKTGTIESTANPVVASSTFNFGDDGATPAGTYPTGWKWKRGNTVYDPTIRSADANPVVKVLKNDATTGVALLATIGLICEYTTTPNPT